MLILRGLKSGQFQTTHLSKAVNAHDCYRGLYLLDVLGSPEPHIANKKKVHVFLCPQVGVPIPIKSQSS